MTHEHAEQHGGRREARHPDAGDGRDLLEQLVSGDVFPIEEISLTRLSALGGKYHTGCEVADIEASEPDWQREPQLP